ncbi:MAG: ABC transporter ATP-binding protein [Clostridiales bacterium]|nr:ABC transporter ATP-binding protein [Candidatus Apopatousia equi]
MDKELLKIKDLKLIYHSKIGETEALKNINLSIKDGEFIAIVGPSGCGKTTILSLISGLLKPSSGEITLQDKKLEGINKDVGYMFQKDHLFEWRTIWQNVCLGLEISKTKTPENERRVEDLLKKYGLINFKNNKPKQLSGGMRQRVALIRTLALNPKILLLDEPFSALDYQTRLLVGEDVWKIIKEEKQTAILVTHDISEAISLSDRVIVLTKSPAAVKKEIEIPFKNESPLKRRENEEFSKVFDEIWKEMITDEKLKK